MRAFMAATMAAMLGSGGPAAATPLGGVVMRRVTSVPMVDCSAATLEVRTGVTVVERRSVATWVAAAFDALVTSWYARRYSAPARGILGAMPMSARAAATPASAAAVLFRPASIFVA